MSLLSPNPFVQFLNPLLVGHKPRFAAVGAALLHGNVAFLTFPQADVGVVGAFGGLGVNVVRIFDETAAVGTHIAELAVLADVNLVLADVPQVLESRLLDGLLQRGVADITIALGHGRAVLDVALRIDAHLAIETGVVALGFGEMLHLDAEIFGRDFPAIRRG